MQPETILIVDDDRAIANLTATWIRAAGFAPVEAYDGRSGVAAVLKHRPRLLLLDIRMPDIDGFEVCRQLKQMPEIDQTPVIFLSANAQEAARRQAIEAGARCFLSKPYEPKDLIVAVRAALAAGAAPS